MSQVILQNGILNEVFRTSLNNMLTELYGKVVTGTVWLWSVGVPDNVTGVNGDFNLRTSNGDVYQKVTGSWTVIGNLKGAAGTNAPNLQIQYSADGVVVWHTNFIVGDQYIRTSVDNGVTWSTAAKFVGSNGTNAPNLQSQYSIDGVTLWHTPWVIGDYYIRTSADGGTTWTNAMKFVGPGIAIGGLVDQYLAKNSLTDYDTKWVDFPTSVRAALLTGLSTVSNVTVTAVDSVLAAIGKLQGQINKVFSYFADEKANGIPEADKAKFTIDYNPLTRIVTLTRISDWSYYVNGVRFAVTTNIVFTPHTDATGLYFMYFDGSGNPTVSATPWDLIETAQITNVYYNISNDGSSADGIVMDERHGMIMSPATHKNLHKTRGSQYISGGSLADYVVQSATVADVTYSISDCTFADEDIEHVASAQVDASNYMLGYFDASGKFNWRMSNIPFFIGAGGNIEYNQMGTGLTEITLNGKYVNYYIFAINNTNASRRFLILPSQTVYNSLAEAQAETVASLNLSALPFIEWVGLWQITMRREGAYTTATGNSRIEATPVKQGLNYANIVGTSGLHNSLNGRSDVSCHPASSVTNTPSGNIVSTTIQNAINELGNILNYIKGGSGTNASIGNAGTTASGNYSHSQNNGTKAQGLSQTVLGEFNVAQGTAGSRASTDNALIVGNGTADGSRSNALALTWAGDLSLASSLLLGSGGSMYDATTVRTVLSANGDRFDIINKAKTQFIFVADYAAAAPQFKGQVMWHAGNLRNGLGTTLPATTGAMTATMDGTYKTLTPTGDCTLNATGGIAGQSCSLVVTTSGSTSYNITFGTNFKSTGVLVTGVTTAKKFTVTFIYDGTNWNETSRTVAM